MPCCSQPLHFYPSSSHFLTSTTMSSSSNMSYFCGKRGSFVPHNLLISIHEVKYFYRVILHCMNTTEFVYPFSRFWTYGLFLVLVGFFFLLFVLFWAMNTVAVNILTQVYAWTYVFKIFLDKYLGVKMPWSQGRYMFIENTHSFSKWLYYSRFQPAEHLRTVAVCPCQYLVLPSFYSSNGFPSGLLMPDLSSCLSYTFCYKIYI